MSVDTLNNRRTITPALDMSYHINGRIVSDLREHFHESLAQFGERLGRAVDPTGKTKYSRQYISAIEHDKPGFRITKEIEGAIWSMAAVLDDVPAGVGGAVSASVLAAPGQVPDGTYIPPTAQAVRCARPGCRVMFLKVNHFQKYHHPDCRKAHREEIAKRRK